MHEVMLAHPVFCMLRDLIGERCQLLIFRKLELHLLICEKLTECAVFEKVDKEEASLMHLDVVSVYLYLVFDLVDDFLIAVFARAHSHFVLAILVAFKDVDYFQSH